MARFQRTLVRRDAGWSRWVETLLEEQRDTEQSVNDDQQDIVLPHFSTHPEPKEDSNLRARVKTIDLSKIRIVGGAHKILQEYSLFMCNTMLVAVIHKLNHDKSTSTAHLSGCLGYGGRVKRGCVGVNSKHRIASTRILEGSQHNNLIVRQIKY